MSGLGKFLKIETNVGSDRSPRWKTVLGCERIELWDAGTATEVSSNSVRHIFHVAHHEAAKRNARVVYLGHRFNIVQVSDSSKLVGIELTCELVAAERAPERKFAAVSR